MLPRPAMPWLCEELSQWNSYEVSYRLITFTYRGGIASKSLTLATHGCLLVHSFGALILSNEKEDRLIQWYAMGQEIAYRTKNGIGWSTYYEPLVSLMEELDIHGVYEREEMLCHRDIRVRRLADSSTTV